VTDGSRSPSDLSIRKAVERYLRRRQSDSTESSVEAWKYRLKLFTDWTDDVGIERVGDLTGYDLDEYYDLRSAVVEPVTLEGEMWTLKTFLEYLEQIDAVEDGLSESVRIPNLDQPERSNEVSLEPDTALDLLEYYRNSDDRATRRHAFLELAWNTGTRQGGIRALDVRDVHFDKAYVEFHHRPDTGTPLKNKRNGERAVALPPETADILREYTHNHRHGVHDEHGRQPFLASKRGRPGKNTIRSWSYLATLPCLHSACPHGRERVQCEYTEFAHVSKCPSSRSPHKIRTGSITWQLDCGLLPEVVAERVNASIEVIEEHYDVASPRQQMEERRRHHVDRLGLEEDE